MVEDYSPLVVSSRQGLTPVVTNTTAHGQGTPSGLRDRSSGAEADRLGAARAAAFGASHSNDLFQSESPPFQSHSRQLDQERAAPKRRPPPPLYEEAVADSQQYPSSGAGGGSGAHPRKSVSFADGGGRASADGDSPSAYGAGVLGSALESNRVRTFAAAVSGFMKPLNAAGVASTVMLSLHESDTICEYEEECTMLMFLSADFVLSTIHGWIHRMILHLIVTWRSQGCYHPSYTLKIAGLLSSELYPEDCTVRRTPTGSGTT